MLTASKCPLLDLQLHSFATSWWRCDGRLSLLFALLTKKVWPFRRNIISTYTRLLVSMSHLMVLPYYFMGTTSNFHQYHYIQYRIYRCSQYFKCASQDKSSQNYASGIIWGKNISNSRHYIITNLVSLPMKVQFSSRSLYQLYWLYKVVPNNLMYCYNIRPFNHVHFVALLRIDKHPLSSHSYRHV